MAFFTDGVGGGIVGVATGVREAFAGLEVVDDRVLLTFEVWLIIGELLADFVEEDTVTCLTVTLLLIVAGLEVLAEVFDGAAFVAGVDLTVLEVVVRLEDDAVVVFVVVAAVLEDDALRGVMTFFAGTLFRNGTSSSLSSLASLSLTSSSLLGSSRFRLTPVFAPFTAALPLDIAVAGTSQ